MADQPLSTDMIDYYQRRAPYYDAFYQLPERQADLQRLKVLIPLLFTGRNVIEVAAGTGYWTQLISATAETVHATDYNTAPLDEAARRHYPRSNVRFQRADAFALDEVAGQFTGAFAGFWWSHVPLDEIDVFLRTLCSRLRQGSTVAFLDNRYVEGNSGPIVRTDAQGNTYQHRRLRDGTMHEVQKNLPQPDQLLQAVSAYGTVADVVELNYFWLLTFTTQ
jgi:SAM-dependent methyltransferase